MYRHTTHWSSALNILTGQCQIVVLGGSVMLPRNDVFNMVRARAGLFRKQTVLATTSGTLADKIPSGCIHQFRAVDFCRRRSFERSIEMNVSY